MNEKGEKRKQEGSSDKAAKKAKFFSTNKGVTLPLNTRGILISCIPNKAKLAGQEAIRVLLPYYEEIAPSSKAKNGDGKDISSILADEVADLKDPKKQIFRLHETGIHSLVYVSMAEDAPGPGPSELVQAIAEDIHRTRQCKVRLCMRFTPIEAVCPVSLESIKEAAETVVWPRFNTNQAESLKFAVAYEHRASTGLDRLTVIKTVADGIKQPPHKADLSHPDLTILVQVVKDACAIGVASKYKELAKYNLRELCNPEADASKKTASKGNGETARPIPERPVDKAELQEKEKSGGAAATESSNEASQALEKSQPNPERPIDKAELEESDKAGGTGQPDAEQKKHDVTERSVPNPERPQDKTEQTEKNTAQKA